MHDIIKEIIRKGSAEVAGIREQQKMLSLFHRQCDEYELKSLLLEDLENTPIGKESTDELSKSFSNIWDRISKSESSRIARPMWLYPFMRVAAALLIGLFIGVYITFLWTSEEPVYYTAHSPLGSVSEWTLPDGTVIFLNAGSEIKYSTGTRGLRTVHLTGEAWFDVSADKKRPFVVNTSWHNIKVTGTKFNVKAYDDDREVITTLEEGKIILMSSEDNRFGNNITLNPGEQAVFNKDSKQLDLTYVNTRWYTSWKENKLIFMNMNLKDLIVLLERKYGVDIVVRNPEILVYHCDGTFKNETIIEVFEIIKKTLPINYKIAGQQIEITSK